MANTNSLIIGSVLLIGGILTIPIGIGIFCAPAGCLVMLIGLLMSNPGTKQKVDVYTHGIEEGKKPTNWVLNIVTGILVIVAVFFIFYIMALE